MSSFPLRNFEIITNPAKDKIYQWGLLAYVSDADRKYILGELNSIQIKMAKEWIRKELNHRGVNW